MFAFVCLRACECLGVLLRVFDWLVVSVSECARVFVCDVSCVCVCVFSPSC